jgi:hypothetical protein
MGRLESFGTSYLHDETYSTIVQNDFVSGAEQLKIPRRYNLYSIFSLPKILGNEAQNSV